MKAIKCFVTLMFLYTSTCYSKKIPEFITLCKRNDPKLNECFLKSYNEVIIKAANGIPEMGIRPIDPLDIDKLSLKFGNSTSVSFDASLNGVKLYGLSKMKLMKCNIDLPNRVLELSNHVDETYMSGQYNSTGKVLLINFNGGGQFRVNITNINTDDSYVANVQIKNNKKVLKWDNKHINISMGGFNSYFDNLFPNNKEITENTNKIINENAESLYNELKPLFEEVITSVFKDILNKVSSIFTIDELFPLV